LLKTIQTLRWPVFIGAFVVTAVFAAFLGRIEQDTSAEGSIPFGDPSQVYFESIKEDFGNDQVAMLVVVSPDSLGVFAPATLAKIRRVTDRIAELDGVDNVVSLTNATFLSGLGGEELTNDLLVPKTPVDRAAARALRDDILANTLFHKTLVSPDGRVAALNIFLSSVSDSVIFASGVDDSLSNIVIREAGPEELYYAGLTHTRVEISRTMSRDLRVFVPLGFTLVLLVLGGAFRMFKAVVVPALTITIAIIWAFGLTGMLGIPIVQVMTMVPPLMMAICCSLVLHVITTNLQVAATGEAADRSVRRAYSSLGGPLLIAGLTTAIGFASLMSSPVPNIRKVGLFATAGVFIIILLMFTFVPAAYTIFPLRPRRRGGGTPFAGLLQRIVRFNLRHRRLMLAVALITMVLSIVGMTRIRVDTDFLTSFKKNSPVRVAADVIEENLAGVNTFYVIAEGDNADAMREARVLGPLSDLQDYMEAKPEIDKATSMINMVKLFHQALHADDPDSFAISPVQDTLDEEIFLTIDCEEPAVRARYVVEDFSSMAIFVRAKSMSTGELAVVIEDIERRGAELLPDDVRVEATGTPVIFAKSVSAIIRGQRNSLVLAFVLIFVLIAILFRSVPSGLLAMLPNFVPVFFVLGLMGWLDIPLSLGTSVVATIALGIGVDDTIHYFLHYRRHINDGHTRELAVAKTLEQAGAPFILTSLSLILGFMVLCFSNFGMLFSVGLLTSLAMVACLVSDLFFTSALLLNFGTKPKEETS